MEFHYERSYRGGVKLCVFDWAGTTVDYGCMAPAAAFRELFKRHGVEPSIAQARGPMGMHKRDHIRTMLQMPELSEKWQAAHGAAPTEDDVERLFQEFIPLQLDVLKHHAKLIPGVADTVDALRETGILIGATTGYNEEMMGICMEAAAAEGYSPDLSIAVTMVPAGRPAPWMAVKCAMELNVWPLCACVKIGDTVTDIDEGLNAGMWTVGVVKTGNELGMTLDEVEAMDSETLEQALFAGRLKLAQAGAHYVIDAVEDLLEVIEDIDDRISAGDTP